MYAWEIITSPSDTFLDECSEIQDKLSKVK